MIWLMEPFAQPGRAAMSLLLQYNAQKPVRPIRSAFFIAI
jgi:hypothetical protein